MSERLPKGWTRTHLGALIDGFEAGRNLRAHGRPATGSEYGVLKVSAVSWGRFQPEENKALLPGDSPRAREFVANGDLLISRANTTELVGAVARVEGEYPYLMLPDKILRLCVRQQIVDATFLMHALRISSVRKHFEANATGTSDSMRNLSQPKMESAPVLLPPLNEQRRIVAKLESLQERSRRARDSLDAVPALLDKLRQSILAAAFRGDLTRDFREKHKDLEPASKLLQRIRTERRKKWEEAELAKLTAKGKPPTDDKWKSKYKEPDPVDTTGLPKLPDGWCWASPREVFGWASGEFLPRSAQLEGPYPVYGGNGVNGSHKDFIISDPTIVIGRVGAECGNVHITSGPAWVTDNAIYAGIVSPSGNLSYWTLALSHSNLRSQARGGGQPFVSQETLNSMLVPLPPEKEQDQLVSIVRAFESHLQMLKETIRAHEASLDTLDRAILAKAFRGELVPQDPRDEPADVMLARTSASPAPAREKRGRRPGAKESHPE